MNNIILDIDSCGIGKQKARQNSSKICLNYEELTHYINFKLNKTRIKNKQKQISLEHNEYIIWGKQMLNSEYQLRVNSIECLNDFDNVISLDSEGFPYNGLSKYPKIIQIADEKTVAIFDYEKFHKKLIPFLKSKTLIMCGSENDFKYLKFKTNNYIDIQQIFKIDGKVISLKKMIGKICNKEFIKPNNKFYIRENWDLDTMDDFHLIYAATDAIATYKVFKYIQYINK